jgi:hypothetical protein
VYIEFSLGEGVGGLPAYRKLEIIKEEIKNWAQRYDVAYTQKTIKYTHRLGFNNEKHFSLFSMTWTPEIPFQIVNIANEKY